MRIKLWEEEHETWSAFAEGAVYPVRSTGEKQCHHQCTWLVTGVLSVKCSACGTLGVLNEISTQGEGLYKEHDRLMPRPGGLIGLKKVTEEKYWGLAVVVSVTCTCLAETPPLWRVTWITERDIREQSVSIQPGDRGTSEENDGATPSGEGLAST